MHGAFRVDLLTLLSEIFMVGLDLNNICQEEKGKVKDFKRK